MQFEAFTPNTPSWDVVGNNFTVGCYYVGMSTSSNGYQPKLHTAGATYDYYTGPIYNSQGQHIYFYIMKANASIVTRTTADLVFTNMAKLT